MSRNEDLIQFAANHYLTSLQAAHGSAGVDLARQLHPHLKRVYAAIDYESINGSLTVYVSLDGQSSTRSRTSAVRLWDFKELAAHNAGTLTLEVVSQTEIYAWPEQVDPASLGAGLLCYTYTPNSGEQFWVDGQPKGDSSPANLYPLFGLPVFRDLHEALHRYATEIASSSECPILKGIWREPERIAWQPKPESRMRDSLYFFLKNVLVDGVPDPVRESPVDDRNPVDITVRWANSNRIALIEVKWLGASGKLNPPRITKRYRADRAVKGLRQIANYVDLTRLRAPKWDPRGYLIVFDGRRAKVGPDTEVVTRAQGVYYRNLDIEYEPEILSRHDIAAPVRCFCEPDFAVASPSSGAYVF